MGGQITAPRTTMQDRAVWSHPCALHLPALLRGSQGFSLVPLSFSSWLFFVPSLGFCVWIPVGRSSRHKQEWCSPAYLACLLFAGV